MPVRSRAPTLLLSVVALGSTAACAGTVGASAAGTDGAAPETGALCSAVVEPGELSKEEARALLVRVDHEVAHVGVNMDVRVTALRGSTGDYPVELTLREDHGAMAVTGTLSVGVGHSRATLSITFARYTGMHGGWGYSALEGTVSVGIDVTPSARRLTVCGPLQLVGGGALRGTPTAHVGYGISGRGGAAVYDGRVGTFDVANFRR